MRVEIKLAGIEYELNESLRIDEGRGFAGSGCILASAIKRESKNAYRVYAILDDLVGVWKFPGMKKAVEFLERVYGEFGVFPGMAKKSRSKGKK